MGKQKTDKYIFYKNYIYLILLISGSVCSENAIFKNGFEDNLGIVQGTVQGLVSTGLVLKLISDGNEELLTIENNGVFSFSTRVSIGSQWVVEASNLPNIPLQQNCQLTNNSGTMTEQGVNNILVNCITVESHWNDMNWDTNQWN